VAAGRPAAKAGHGGAVGAAAEEAAGLAAVQPALHRIAQQSPKRLAQGVEVAASGLVEARYPVRLHGDAGAILHDAVTRRQTMDVLEDGPRRRDGVEVQVVEDGLRVELGPRPGELVGSFRETQLAIHQAVAQGLDREAVDRADRTAIGQVHADGEAAAHLGRRGQRRLRQGLAPHDIGLAAPGLVLPWRAAEVGLAQGQGAGSSVDGHEGRRWSGAQ
jgi:hypothetical protein